MSIYREQLKVAKYLKLVISDGIKSLYIVSPDIVTECTLPISHPSNFLAILKSSNPYECLTCCLYLEDVLNITSYLAISGELE